jgi:uncharacterized protein YndB with AHSA1/START domain
VKKSIRIQEQIEIQAPAEEVFAILTQPEKHLQLGPDWGEARLGQISDDYPQSGSSYQLIPVQADEPPFATIVTEFVPLRRIALRVDRESEYQASWEVEDLGASVRLSYQAEFWLEASVEEPEPAAEESDDPLTAAFNQPETFERKAVLARREAAAWLSAIKRYAELRETRLRLWIRLLMDRYILRLRSDQRRIILALIAMQVITCLTFIAAVVGIGLASLIF